jgi:hypothetical protein
MSRSNSSGFKLTTLGIFGGIFLLGIAIGIALSSSANLNSGNVASRSYIDRSAPNAEMCVQYGASSIVMETRTFLTMNPFTVYISQPTMQPGCVLREENWAVLEKRDLVDSEDVRECRRRMNTFGYTGKLDKKPDVDCIYQTDNQRISFPNIPGSKSPEDTQDF